MRIERPSVLQVCSAVLANFVGDLLADQDGSAVLLTVKLCFTVLVTKEVGGSASGTAAKTSAFLGLLRKSRAFPQIERHSRRSFKCRPLFEKPYLLGCYAVLA